ncbi:MULTISPECIES: helix-turn-helix transcriptional regulator [Enterocloster]|uniref:helix-turn-helix domain-containing protein n=1 Tax=Enterocloster TaxID=2719313 RepID=UPI002A7F9639|nr:MULTISPECIES: helix-turn-helix transcriptional regulator [Enterocloster]
MQDMQIYEKEFRDGLNSYMKDKLIKSTSVADKAGIRRDTFSRILNGGRRIYAEEVASICKSLEVSFEFLLSYTKQTHVR